MLNQNKYLFMPIFNVDGVADIEENWKKFGTIIPRRKNLHEGCATGNTDMGVDLNRNFAVDFGQVDDIVSY
jgi:hypothetical protein